MRAAKFTESRFIPVKSEMLVAVRYSEEDQQLDVIFRTGEKYRYLRVPRAEYDGLISAESLGQYMHKNILGGRYEYERL